MRSSSFPQSVFQTFYSPFEVASSLSSHTQTCFVSLLSEPDTHGAAQYECVNCFIEALFPLNGFLNPTPAPSSCCGMSLAGFSSAFWDRTSQCLFLLLQLILPPEYCPDAHLLIYRVGISIPLDIPSGCRALIRCFTPALNCCGRESAQDRK